jgi:hypothetical protein
MRYIVLVAGMNACRTFLGKPEGKRPLRIHRYRQEVSIEMELRKIGWFSVNWIHLAQDR